MIFEIIDYDVWGNAEDGYEVNQAFHTGDLVYLSENYTVDEVGLEMSSRLRENILDYSIDISHADVIYISYVGEGEEMPVCELRFSRFENALKNAQDAFWESVITSYPEAISGDLDPGTTIDLDKAMREALNNWVEFNVEGQ